MRIAVQSAWLLQEAACRRKAVLAYFGEKRHACQPQHELPCDFCQNRKLVTSQLQQLTAVQQANAMAELNKQQSSAAHDAVKAVWQMGASPHSKSSKLPLASISPASDASVSRKLCVLQPLKELGDGRAGSSLGKRDVTSQLPTQPCRHLCTGSEPQEQQRPHDEVGGALTTMPACDHAQKCDKQAVRPVIKRAKYNTAFKPPRRV